jgi:hypothetical protein
MYVHFTLILPFFKRFPKIEEKLPLLFNAGEPGTMSLYILYKNNNL